MSAAHSRLVVEIGRQMQDFRPIAGFSPAQAGHSDPGATPDVPVLRHFLSARFVDGRFKLTLGTTGAFDVTMRARFEPGCDRLAVAGIISRHVWCIQAHPIAAALLSPQLVAAYEAYAEADFFAGYTFPEKGP